MFLDFNASGKSSLMYTYDSSRSFQLIVGLVFFFWVENNEPCALTLKLVFHTCQSWQLNSSIQVKGRAGEGVKQGRERKNRRAGGITPLPRVIPHARLFFLSLPCFTPSPAPPFTWIVDWHYCSCTTFYVRDDRLD